MDNCCRPTPQSLQPLNTVQILDQPLPSTYLSHIKKCFLRSACVFLCQRVFSDFQTTGVNFTIAHMSRTSTNWPHWFLFFHRQRRLPAFWIWFSCTGRFHFMKNSHRLPRGARAGVSFAVRGGRRWGPRSPASPLGRRLGLKRVGEERKGEEDVRTSSNLFTVSPFGTRWSSRAENEKPLFCISFGKNYRSFTWSSTSRFTSSDTLIGKYR